MAERLVSFFADSRLRPTWCHLGCCVSNSKRWHPWAVQSILFFGCAWVKRMTGGDVHTKESMSQRSCRGRMWVVGSRSSPFAFFGIYSRIADGLVGNSCKGNLTTWKATQFESYPEKSYTCFLGRTCNFHKLYHFRTRDVARLWVCCNQLLQTQYSSHDVCLGSEFLPCFSCIAPVT